MEQKAESIAKEILYYPSTVTYATELIKAYGKQCAEQALKDAADNVEWTPYMKECILTTPISTP